MHPCFFLCMYTAADPRQRCMRWAIQVPKNLSVGKKTWKKKKNPHALCVGLYRCKSVSARNEFAPSPLKSVSGGGFVSSFIGPLEAFACTTRTVFRFKCLVLQRFFAEKCLRVPGTARLFTRPPAVVCRAHAAQQQQPSP